MKKTISTLFFMAVISLFSFAENKTLKITLTLSSDFGNGNITFNSDSTYINNTIVRELEKGRRAFSWQVPKEAYAEGEYRLFIYENNNCIATYTICNTHYLYNEQKDRFEKVPYILDRIRGILFVEYLQNKEKSK